MNYPPKVSVSALMNSLKGVSSRMIRLAKCPSIHRQLWGGALWSPSYFAGSCGGASIAVIRQYIEQQKKPVIRGRRSRPRYSSPPRKGEVCPAL